MSEPTEPRVATPEENPEENPEQDPEEDSEEESRKDQYCYICEDGGSIIECSICTKACCYDIIGQKGPNPTQEPDACVSIPASMAVGTDIMFPCPDCVSKHQPRSIGYFINRGARTTMRVVSRSSVAIVIYHLHSHSAAAKTLADQLMSALQVFYVNVAWQIRLLHHGIEPGDAKALFDELPSELPYHLVVLFLTEGDPQGGWWHTSLRGNQKDGRVSEKQFLVSCLHNLGSFARKAATARVFGIACGFNLRVKGSIASVEAYLRGTAFISLVMPSTCSLLVCEYITILPELFVNLYYFGTALEPALMRIWGKSSEVRTHTGLMIMERASIGVEFTIKNVCYSPKKSCPFGVALPITNTVCGCDNGQASWIYQTEKQNRSEVVFLYRSSCCKTQLQVGIHPAQRRSLMLDDNLFTEERWDTTAQAFLFKETSNVCMRVIAPNAGRSWDPVDLSQMWTKSGRKRAKALERLAAKP